MIGHPISRPVIGSTNKGRTCHHHKTRFADCNCSAIEHLVEAAQIVLNMSIIAERMMCIRGHSELCSKNMFMNNCSCGAKKEMSEAVQQWEGITSGAAWWMDRFNNVMRVEQVCEKL